jgi:hypothetical protein
MTKKNIQCSLSGLGRTTVLQAQWRRGFDSIAGSRISRGQRCRGLGEDDCAMGRRHHGLGNDVECTTSGLREDDVVVGLGTALRAWGRGLCGRRRHRRGSRKMAARKGARLWSRTMARRLWGGLDDGAAPGRTQWWHGLWAGRWWHGLHGNFWWKILAAWRCQWKPPRIRVWKDHITVYL